MKIRVSSGDHNQSAVPTLRLKMAQMVELHAGV